MGLKDSCRNQNYFFVRGSDLELSA